MDIQSAGNPNRSQKLEERIFWSEVRESFARGTPIRRKDELEFWERTKGSDFKDEEWRSIPAKAIGAVLIIFMRINELMILKGAVDSGLELASTALIDHARLIGHTGFM